MARKAYVTPDVPTCFWCRNRKPLRLVTPWFSAAHDYEPCPDCRELCNRGVFVIEIRNQPNSPNQPWLTPEMPGAFPTGQWRVVSRQDMLSLGFPLEVLKLGVVTTSPAGFAQVMGKINLAKRPTLVGVMKHPNLQETVH